MAMIAAFMFCPPLAGAALYLFGRYRSTRRPALAVASGVCVWAGGFFALMAFELFRQSESLAERRVMGRYVKQASGCTDNLLLGPDRSFTRTITCDGAAAADQQGSWSLITPDEVQLTSLYPLLGPGWGRFRTSAFVPLCSTGGRTCTASLNSCRVQPEGWLCGYSMNGLEVRYQRVSQDEPGR
jgi:hypothetical protein